MNNKKIGSDFEQEACSILASRGYWVKFLDPDMTGAQPFDIIAVKNGIAYCFDCKTCVSNTFNINRLEDNQIMAFEKWVKCGNTHPMVLIKHKNEVKICFYADLKINESVKIDPLMSLDIFLKSIDKHKNI